MVCIHFQIEFEVRKTILRSEARRGWLQARQRPRLAAETPSPEPEPEESERGLAPAPVLDPDLGLGSSCPCVGAGAGAEGSWPSPGNTPHLSPEDSTSFSEPGLNYSTSGHSLHPVLQWRYSDDFARNNFLNVIIVDQATISTRFKSESLSFILTRCSSSFWMISSHTGNWGNSDRNLFKSKYCVSFYSSGFHPEDED